MGQGKGRLDLLMDIHTSLVRAGLSCRLHVVTDRVDLRAGEGFVGSRERMSYAASTRLARSAWCFLELVPEYQAGLSLRCVEAIVYRKKLLTNHAGWSQASGS